MVEQTNKLPPTSETTPRTVGFWLLSLLKIICISGTAIFVIVLIAGTIRDVFVNNDTIEKQASQIESLQKVVDKDSNEIELLSIQPIMECNSALSNTPCYFPPTQTSQRCFIPPGSAIAVCK